MLYSVLRSIERTYSRTRSRQRLQSTTRSDVAENAVQRSMLSVSRLLSFGSMAAVGQGGLLFSAVAAASLLIGGLPVSAQTMVAGVTPGAIAVDESGSANYSIPLSVPPGVAGMAPSLSLIYGSRGDNGILGVGWSLGGLSVIHRCGKTKVQDDTISGVDYSANDRFCLDGQRLVATDGVYGANGTVYSTELASFSKIVSYGTAGAGPAHFKVWTKSGQIMTYGNTADSKVEVPGQTDVRYWSVNRIEDRVGNYLDLVYSDDTTNNVHQIDRINYAGNTVAATPPTASVRFVYETRTDTRVHYMAGVRTQTLNRLKSIETYATFGAVDTLVKRYDMAYEYGTATGRSRLTSLTECDANNNCLEPHSFTYSDHTAGSTFTQNAGYALPDVILDKKSEITRGQFQDVNGDGLVDWVRAYRNASGTYSMITWLNTGSGWQNNAGYALPDVILDKKSEIIRGQFQDVNGDGLVDWVRAYRNASGTYSMITWLNTGSGWQNNAGYALPDVILDKKSEITRGQFQDVNGDGLVDWVRAYRNASGTYSMITWLNNSGGSDLLVSGTDGLGRVASITYKPLTDDSVYTKGSGASFPEIDIQAPMYVVASVSQDDGKTETPGNLEGQAVINYSYAGAKVNTEGRGFLGFRTVTARDEQTGILTTTTYNQTYPFTGQVDSSVTRLDNGVVVDLVKEVASTYASKLIFDGTASNQPSVLFPYADSSTSKAYEISRQDLQSNQVAGFLVSSTTTSSTYDDYGNALSITQSVTDETTGATAGQVFTTQTASLYDNDEVNWILGRVTSTTVTKSRPGAPNQSRKSAWEYNATNGLLTKEIIEPDIASLKVTTSYTYDSFGNETAVSVSGTGVTSRSSTTSYDTNGQFPLSSANALSHSETMVTDARFGVVTSLTGPNGITTTWEYDGFGRKTKELRADGTESRISYDLCDTVCQPGAVYKITSQDFLTAGGTALNTPSIQYYDKMNRVFRTESIAFDGVTKIYVDTSYNPRGESHMVSRPYFEGVTPLWATTHYDDLGRRMSVIAPDGGIQVFDYGGLTTTINNALNQNMTKTQNAIGELVTSTDNLSGTVTYSYDAYGNLLQTNANGVLTTMTYDQRGRKTGMTDPDMGVWSYSYNVLGELISQTDAKLQTVTMAYDVLGRMTSRIEAEGTTTWTYDTATKGKGKIHQVSGPNGYLEVADYDSLGRPDSTSTTISGTLYQTSLTYDAQGRPDTITYPSGFAVQNNYTANGFLGSVSEVLSSTVYWQADTVDAEGMVTQETLGNGVVTNRAYDPATALLDSIQTTHGGTSIQNLSFVFDTLGNLSERNDLTRDRKEAFVYDGLNRVTSTTLTDTSNATTLNTTTYAYDNLGNITNKSDVGAYLYGQNGAGPHAVTTAGSNTYTYDLNGSMISGAGRTTAWTSFNKPQNVTDSVTGNWTSFVYGPSRARIQQNAQTNGLTTTTDYVGSSYERRSRLNQPDELVHYIRAGGGTVAIYTKIDDGNALTDKTRYLHKDHLGSVESITDEQGLVTEHLSYDAHGKRRLTDWNAGVPAASSETPRGFTGHEHLDGVGLIHMNGRVYDPTLGRFLSADPNVQAPDDTQSFNRYSYVKNNPLSYTDPSGFFFKKIFKKIASVFKKAFKAVKSFVKKALQNQYVTTAIQIGINFVPGLQGWGAILVSAAFSGLVSLANGGDLGQALMSAGIAVASAVAFNAVGDAFKNVNASFLSPGHIAKTVAHGAVGGAISKLRGGEFKSGFLAGAFAQFAAPGLAYVDQYAPAPVGVAAAAVAGGVGEELGGGKFVNGAFTGAFSRLHNDLKHGAAGEPDSGGWLDGFQLGLDIVGLIPVVGNAADLLNAGISLARGDYIGAGASLAAAAPGAGQGVGLANIGRRIAGRVCSFKAGTLVHTKDGLKPIEAIRVGDLVASKDEKTGEVAWKPVLHLFQSKDKPILGLALIGPDGELDVIETTAEHPFWVEGKGWIQTSNLKANDKIESLEGDDLVVQSMSQRAGVFPAYNFEVADFHTYFVGEDGAWVHNANCGVGKDLLNAEPVGSALKGDKHHNAATFMRKDAANNGTHFKITGGDGVVRDLTQIQGNLNGVPGRYEYIVEGGNRLTHQRFVEGGTINGIPNVR
ncbi:polymorphic toxin-type HINT domain-containing protein [Pelagibius sp. Alg239-R121]|uniref:polymorphic toxin-type HINT domain-containing protein n=1 Tax=Pelagibius sp. Alg239-R121 TaxID=2993448 RepID=UPI0024A728AA|nr:polymorphic toxin-type HINT domain-containing protein [Pelagibius sp. Alg239-R121]